MEKQDKAKLYIIDISSFIFRAYYSIGHLSTSSGKPTGAVFGVASMILKLIDEHTPSHLVVAMDSKTPTFRRDIFPEYKANRPPPPPDLVEQFPIVEDLVRGFNIPVLQKDGFEADDVIATVTRRALEENFAVVIVSSDKDLMQLVGEHVVLLDTMKNLTIDAEKVEQKWGVPPSLLGDLLALAGDSSDNIPGVPRVGPKTAAPLLLQYGSLEELLENRGALKSKALAKRLEDHIENARLSRRLVELEAGVPIEFEIQNLARTEPDAETLGNLLENLEFHSLKERLFGPSSADSSAAEKPAYHTLTEEDALRGLAKTIRDTRRLAVDLETTSVDAVQAEIVGVSLCCSDKEAWYIPVAHRDGPKMSLDTVLNIIGPLLEDPEIEVVIQNLKYEDTIFRRHGIWIQNIAFDPMLASYLVRVDGRSHKLDVLARELLGKTMISYDEVTEKSRGHQLMFDEVSVEKATEYSGEDALMAWCVADKMQPMVRAAHADSLLYDLEIPLARVLCSMELAGIRVNTGLLGEMSDEFAEKLSYIEKEAHTLAGKNFNLASPKQLQEILFDQLHLPVQKKTKTGYSTDSEVLEILAPMHPLPALLLDHRMLSKLKNTYLDALPRLVNTRTKRIHTSFNQAVTATGRLSSSNPNLQNIPVRSDLGRKIRQAFVAEEGKTLVSADYSQVELRILAHLSEDPELTSAFQTGDDIHSRTARAIFGYGPEEPVDPHHRAQAKAVNFGVIYGKTDFSLAKELQISRNEARRFITEYFRLYSGVERYMNQTIEQASRDRHVTTLLGRKRELRDIQSKNANVRKQAERMARNTPIQGTAADLLKLAMIRVDDCLRKNKLNSRMLLTVHDELVFEVPDQELETITSLVRREMESALSLNVPLVVDMGFGTNWADAH